MLHYSRYFAQAILAFIILLLRVSLLASKLVRYFNTVLTHDINVYQTAEVLRTRIACYAVAWVVTDLAFVIL